MSTRRARVYALQTNGIGDPAPFDYYHNSVSEAELFELLELDLVSQDILAVALVATSQTETEKSKIEDGFPCVTDTVDDGDLEKIHISAEDLSLQNSESAENEFDEFRILDAEWDLLSNEITSSDLILDVPDFCIEELDEYVDFIPEIRVEDRARQQAIAFLVSIGELTNIHVSWIVEIILARRWSAAQRKVIELIQSGFSLRSVYLSFILSEYWRDSDVFDERFDEVTRGYAWMSSCQPRLSWWQSIQLITFHGEDCDLEVVIEFIEEERHVWRRSRTLTRRFPQFKDYLLRHRIADECRLPSGDWHRMLDPRDSRTFDGSTNPEYTTQWWEDEITPIGDANHVQRRIYMGESIGSLIAEPDDGLHWVEE